MAIQWMRRTAVVAACASAALLAACGSSTIESAITPDRFIAFGDALTDVGQKGTRYTVNDGSVNNWTLQLVANYNKPLTAAVSGGNSYATGSARVTAKPDATGSSTTLTITEQVDAYLAKGTFNKNDVVIVSGGLSDVIAGVAAVNAGTQTSAEMTAAARKAGQELGAQVRRLVKAGAQHVLLTGTYDLGKTPWAKALGKESLLSDASARFNEGLLVDIVDLGANVLYVDAAYYVNLFTGVPANYGFKNTTDAVCNSVDAANGIGIGAGEVNSGLCSASTLVSGASQDTYVFADKVHLTPSAHRQFGAYAYDRLRARW